jgi:hypothetical protein
MTSTFLALISEPAFGLKWVQELCSPSKMAHQSVQHSFLLRDTNRTCLNASENVAPRMLGDYYDELNESYIRATHFLRVA